MNPLEFYRLFSSKRRNDIYAYDTEAPSIELLADRMDQLDSKEIPWFVIDHTGLRHVSYRISKWHKNIMKNDLNKKNGNITQQKGDLK